MKARLLGFGMRVATVGLLVAGTGCGMDNADDAVGVTRGALTNQDFTDSSGLVHVRVKTCDWVAAAEHPAALCPVDSGYVLVGGGAEVEGSAPGGGLLTKSYPFSKTIWFASSSDHVVAYAHRLRAYSVGMLLSDLPAATLSGLVTISQATSSASHAPTATTPQIPIGDVLLSGGAASNATGAGQLLTGSMPWAPAGTNLGWTATAKDHQVSDVASVTAYAISVPNCLNNQWTAHPGKCLFGSSPANSVSSGAGYAAAVQNTPVGFAPVGVGGRARYNGSGRMLTDLFPLNLVGQPGATADSKDHNIADSGITDVWAMSIEAL